MLSDGTDLVFNHTFGKTLKGDGKLNRFVIKRCDDQMVCPVGGIDDSETLHSMWAGCAVTHALKGSVETKGVMDHIGWFSKRSADHYSRSSKLIDSVNVANALAKSVNN